MGNVNDLVRKDIHDFCGAANGFRWGKVVALKVRVSVKVVARFGGMDQPINGFKSLMGWGVLIMNSKGRRMGDEDIEGAAIIYLVEH